LHRKYSVLQYNEQQTFIITIITLHLKNVPYTAHLRGAKTVTNTGIKTSSVPFKSWIISYLGASISVFTI